MLSGLWKQGIFLYKTLSFLSNIALGHGLVNRAAMALQTAKICKKKGEKRVFTRFRPFLMPDCSSLSVLGNMANLSAAMLYRFAETQNRPPLLLATLVCIARA